MLVQVQGTQPQKVQSFRISFRKGALATSFEEESRMMILMLTVVVIVAASMCWTSGTVLSSLFYIILLNPYHNFTRWVSLPFHFTDGKTEAQKVVQGHSSSKRQNKY